MTMFVQTKKIIDMKRKYGLPLKLARLHQLTSIICKLVAYQHMYYNISVELKTHWAEKEVKLRTLILDEYGE